MSTWAYDLSGRCFRIDGRSIMIDEQLTEIEITHLAQRQALTRAHYMDTGERLLMKIRYDLSPKSFDDPEILIYDRDYAVEEFLLECDLVEIVHEIGHGPRYITHLNLKAGRRFSYPKGYVDFLVMSSVPGDNINDIYLDLSDEKLASIRRQLAKTLDYMYQDGFLLGEHDPNYLRYDQANDVLYLMDFTFCETLEPEDGRRITEDSVHVRAFNFWRKHTGEEA